MFKRKPPTTGEPKETPTPPPKPTRTKTATRTGTRTTTRSDEVTELFTYARPPSASAQEATKRRLVFNKLPRTPRPDNRAIKNPREGVIQSTKKPSSPKEVDESLKEVTTKPYPTRKGEVGKLQEKRSTQERSSVYRMVLPEGEKTAPYHRAPKNDRREEEFLPTQDPDTQRPSQTKGFNWSRSNSGNDEQRRQSKGHFDKGVSPYAKGLAKKTRVEDIPAEEDGRRRDKRESLEHSRGQREPGTRQEKEKILPSQGRHSIHGSLAKTEEYRPGSRGERVRTRASVDSIMDSLYSDKSKATKESKRKSGNNQESSYGRHEKQDGRRDVNTEREITGEITQKDRLEASKELVTSQLTQKLDSIMDSLYFEKCKAKKESKKKSGNNPASHEKQEVRRDVDTEREITGEITQKDVLEASKVASDLTEKLDAVMAYLERQSTHATLLPVSIMPPVGTTPNLDKKDNVLAAECNNNGAEYGEKVKDDSDQGKERPVSGVYEEHSGPPKPWEGGLPPGYPIGMQGQNAYYANYLAWLSATGYGAFQNPSSTAGLHSGEKSETEKGALPPPVLHPGAYLTSQTEGLPNAATGLDESNPPSRYGGGYGSPLVACGRGNLCKTSSSCSIGPVSGMAEYPTTAISENGGSKDSLSRYEDANDNTSFNENRNRVLEEHYIRQRGTVSRRSKTRQLSIEQNIVRISTTDAESQEQNEAQEPVALPNAVAKMCVSRESVEKELESPDKVLKESVVMNESEVLKELEVWNEPDVLKESEVRNEPEVLNESEILKEPEFMKEAEVMKEPDVMKEPEVLTESEILKHPDGMKETKDLTEVGILKEAEAESPEEIPLQEPEIMEEPKVESPEEIFLLEPEIVEEPEVESSQEITLLEPEVMKAPEEIPLQEPEILQELEVESHEEIPLEEPEILQELEVKSPEQTPLKAPDFLQQLEDESPVEIPLVEPEIIEERKVESPQEIFLLEPEIVEEPEVESSQEIPLLTPDIMKASEDIPLQEPEIPQELEVESHEEIPLEEPEILQELEVESHEEIPLKELEILQELEVGSPDEIPLEEPEFLQELEVESPEETPLQEPEILEELEVESPEETPLQEPAILEQLEVESTEEIPLQEPDILQDLEVESPAEIPLQEHGFELQEENVGTDMESQSCLVADELNANVQESISACGSSSQECDVSEVEFVCENSDMNSVTSKDDPGQEDGISEFTPALGIASCHKSRSRSRKRSVSPAEERERSMSQEFQPDILIDDGFEAGDETCATETNKLSNTVQEPEFLQQLEVKLPEEIPLQEPELLQQLEVESPEETPLQEPELLQQLEVESTEEIPLQEPDILQQLEVESPEEIPLEGPDILQQLEVKSPKEIPLQEPEILQDLEVESTEEIPLEEPEFLQELEVESPKEIPLEEPEILQELGVESPEEISLLEPEVMTAPEEIPLEELEILQELEVESPEEIPLQEPGILQKLEVKSPEEIPLQEPDILQQLEVESPEETPLQEPEILEQLEVMSPEETPLQEPEILEQLEVMSPQEIPLQEHGFELQEEIVGTDMESQSCLVADELNANVQPAISASVSYSQECDESEVELVCENSDVNSVPSEDDPGQEDGISEFTPALGISSCHKSRSRSRNRSVSPAVERERSMSQEFQPDILIDDGFEAGDETSATETNELSNTLGRKRRSLTRGSRSHSKSPKAESPEEILLLEPEIVEEPEVESSQEISLLEPDVMKAPEEIPLHEPEILHELEVESHEEIPLEEPEILQEPEDESPEEIPLQESEILQELEVESPEQTPLKAPDFLQQLEDESPVEIPLVEPEIIEERKVESPEEIFLLEPDIMKAPEDIPLQEPEILQELEVESHEEIPLEEPEIVQELEDESPEETRLEAPHFLKQLEVESPEQTPLKAPEFLQQLEVESPEEIPLLKPEVMKAPEEIPLEEPEFLQELEVESLEETPLLEPEVMKVPEETPLQEPEILQELEVKSPDEIPLQESEILQELEESPEEIPLQEPDILQDLEVESPEEIPLEEPEFVEQLEVESPEEIPLQEPEILQDLEVKSPEEIPLQEPEILQDLEVKSPEEIPLQEPEFLQDLEVESPVEIPLQEHGFELQEENVGTDMESQSCLVADELNANVHESISASGSYSQECDVSEVELVCDIVSDVNSVTSEDDPGQEDGISEFTARNSSVSPAEERERSMSQEFQPDILIDDGFEAGDETCATETNELSKTLGRKRRSLSRGSRSRSKSRNRRERSLSNRVRFEDEETLPCCQEQPIDSGHDSESESVPGVSSPSPRSVSQDPVEVADIQEGESDNEARSAPTRSKSPSSDAANLDGIIKLEDMDSIEENSVDDLHDESEHKEIIDPTTITGYCGFSTLEDIKMFVID